MIGKYKKNIISNLTHNQTNLLPIELWENIENYTNKTSCKHLDVKDIKYPNDND